MNGALKSKTMWFALATTVLGTVQSFTPFLSPDTAGKVMVGVGIVTGILRTITTQSLEAKGSGSGS